MALYTRSDAYFTVLQSDGLRKLKRRLGLYAACMSCALVYLSVLGIAKAQTALPQLEIIIPEVFEIDAAARTPLPLRLEPQAGLPFEATVMIKGLPERLTLSDGRRFQSGIWGVSVGSLNGLNIICPDDEIGSSLLTITIVTADGTVLDGANSKLIIRSPQSASRLSQRSEQNKPPVQSAATQLDWDEEPDNLAVPVRPRFFARTELEEIHAFMKRGAEHIQLKNITVARLFFKRAADLGWAPAALALGATYDPAELLHLHIVGGIRPDVDLARKWYERASELGSEQAREKLAQLAAY